MINMLGAPMLGKAVMRFGERRTLIFEYTGLAIVFAAYGGIYWFGWGVVLAATLYVIDHVLFALALALKTYFQKIANPADIAPDRRSGLLPSIMSPPCSCLCCWGCSGSFSPGAVFGLAVAMALISLALSLLIPRHPEPGNETVLSKFAPPPAE